MELDATVHDAWMVDHSIHFIINFTQFDKPRRFILTMVHVGNKDYRKSGSNIALHKITFVYEKVVVLVLLISKLDTVL